MMVTQSPSSAGMTGNAESVSNDPSAAGSWFESFLFSNLNSGTQVDLRIDVNNDSLEAASATNCRTGRE